VLIFLDVSLVTICARLKVNWEQSYIDEQQRRLNHAREHAHFFLATDAFTREQVAERVIEFLKSKRGV
jgi:hypothetical protein